MSRKKKYQTPFEFWAERLSHATAMEVKTIRGKLLIRWELPLPPFRKRKGVLYAGKMAPQISVAAGEADYATFVDADGVELHRVKVNDYSGNGLNLSSRFICAGAINHLDHLDFRA